MSKTSVRVAVLGALAGLLVVPVRAQVDPMIFNDAMVSTGQTMTMVAAINAQAKNSAAQLKRTGRLPAVSAASAGTRFTPSLPRRKAQASKFLAAVKRMNPEIGKSLAPAFANDPVRYVAPFLGKVGVRTDDVADLTAVYLASAWYGAHGKTTDPRPGELTAIRDQIRRAYRGSPKLRGASSATKQNVGEGLLYLALLNDVFLETMKAHPEAKTRLMQEIAAGAKATFGLNLRAMRITKVGLTGG